MHNQYFYILYIDTCNVHIIRPILLEGAKSGPLAAPQLFVSAVFRVVWPPPHIYYGEGSNFTPALQVFSGIFQSQ